MSLSITPLLDAALSLVLIADFQAAFNVFNFVFSHHSYDVACEEFAR